MKRLRASCGDVNTEGEATSRADATSRGARGLLWGAKRPRLHIQVFDFQGVLFDELAAGFDLVAHEDAEELVGGRERRPS